MSLGILGGTFDPIHNGHLAVARGCRRRFALDRVLLVPARTPPHKEEEAVAAWHHRLAMTSLACHGEEGLAVSALEGSRPGRSYTVDTLQHFRDSLPPGEPLFFLLGADSLLDLPSWREPDRILSLANLIVAPRPGVTRERAVGALDGDLRARVTAASEMEDGPPPPSGCIYWVELPMLDLSGSEIRRRVQAGTAFADLVPEAVAVYIARYHLYR